MLPISPMLPSFFAAAQRFLWHPASATAILSDVHLGAETSLAAAGIFLPQNATAALLAAWREIAHLSPARIIIAGDLFDSANPDWRALDLFAQLLGMLPARTIVTLTPGNHDPDLSFLRHHFPTLHIAPATAIDGVTVFHGHQSCDARGVGNGRWSGPPDAPQRHWLPHGLIVGHQHPAVTLVTRVRSAKMICFVDALLHVHQTAIPLIILPAFSPMPLGTNLRNAHQWILDLPRPADTDMRIAGLIEGRQRAPQVLDFGPISALSDP